MSCFYYFAHNWKFRFKFVFIRQRKWEVRIYILMILGIYVQGCIYPCGIPAVWEKIPQFLEKGAGFIPHI